MSIDIENDILSKEYEEKHSSQNQALQQIRLNFPIVKDSFTITFSYKTSTYTVSLNPPYNQSKTKALNWFNQQGITDLSTIRLRWIEN